MHTAPSFNMCGGQPLSFNHFRNVSKAPAQSSLSSFSWFQFLITVTPVHVCCAGGFGIARVCF